MTGHLGLINQTRKMATSTKRIIINTSAAPKAIGPYNQVCILKYPSHSDKDTFEAFWLSIQLARLID